ncbi:MAG TPA: GYF domain-containing protein, partial [Kofleriaceae bacterium]|nr:GYF domain-containing protein [Kofleriaceae bacterium]
MKFLCDRCKTRYSIGDDRVRGKILKIRCKNCANVITVREGMSDAEAVDAGGVAPRRQRATTAAPLVAQSTALAGNGHAMRSAGGSALGAAFASAMTKPPPALEEEWYVSIDGEQSGPFTLVDAQRWVANKPYDAELHCWSEGFDDWLPVDKVSHFRGLRKKPQPVPVPPPLPRAIPSLGGISRPVAMAPAVRPIIPRDEETPKPLFAAT